jgi:predicted membrane protein
MSERITTIRRYRVQDPASRRSELASLKKMRPFLFWAVIASTITPLGYLISAALVKHTAIFGPIMAWFVVVMNLITYLRMRQRIQVLTLLDQIPPAGVAYDFTV